MCRCECGCGCWPNTFNFNHICYCEKHFIFRMQFKINDFCVRAYACVSVRSSNIKSCAFIRLFIVCFSREKNGNKKIGVFIQVIAQRRRMRTKEQTSIVRIWMQSVLLLLRMVFVAINVINGKVIKTEKVSMEMEMILHRKIGYYLNFNLHKIISFRAFSIHTRTLGLNVFTFLLPLLSLFMMAIW